VGPPWTMTSLRAGWESTRGRRSTKCAVGWSWPGGCAGMWGLPARLSTTSVVPRANPRRSRQLGTRRRTRPSKGWRTRLVVRVTEVRLGTVVNNATLSERCLSCWGADGDGAPASAEARPGLF
jgi:hypothetical protein